MQLIKDVVERNARRFPNELALVHHENRFTFKEHNERVNRLANAFLKLGIKKGDRVSIILDNCHQYCEIMAAASKAGFILAHFSTSLREEFNHVVGNAEPSMMIVGENHAHKFNPEWKSIKEVICVGKAEGNRIDYEQLLADSPADEPNIEVTAEDGLYLYYTSGTTAMPKGALHTNATMAINAQTMISSFNMKYHSERTVTVQPLYFTAPTVCMINPSMYAASPVVILDGFNPQEMFEVIEREKITQTYVVPTMIFRMVEFPDADKYDYSSLRRVIYGSSSIPVTVLKKAINKFGNIFHQLYGLTESHILTFLPADEHIVEGSENEVKRLASCGREMPDCHVRIVRENGSDIKRDAKETGEIIAESECLMKEYFKMPEKTQEAIKDGWIYTGDIASMDKDGYIYILDRKNDLIISGGVNIYPREVEEVLYTHPAVAEAAVVGVSDEEWGEKVKAYIALKPGIAVTEQEIIDFAKGRLASYKKPKEVEFLDFLPKGTTGKILKKELKERAASNS